jgi:transcription elongation GreA/GreB family factor
MAMAMTEQMVVGVWSSVSVQEGEHTMDWVIVPAGSGNPTQGRIDERSPMAKALLGGQPGDKRRVDGPGGAWWVEILAVA